MIGENTEVALYRIVAKDIGVRQKMDDKPGELGENWKKKNTFIRIENQ